MNIYCVRLVFDFVLTLMSGVVLCECIRKSLKIQKKNKTICCSPFFMQLQAFLAKFFKFSPHGVKSKITILSSFARFLTFLSISVCYPTKKLKIMFKVFVKVFFSLLFIIKFVCYLYGDMVEWVNATVARRFEQLFDSRSMVARQLIQFETHVDSLQSHRTLPVCFYLATNDHSTQSLHRL